MMEPFAPSQNRVVLLSCFWTVSLIIWDKVTMMKRQGVEALDNSLHDIMDRPNLSFRERLWCLVEISDRLSQLFKEGQGLK
jgi:hypothetical protein